MDDDTVFDQFIADCDEDYVGFHELVALCVADTPAHEPSALDSRLRDVLETSLASGRVVAGNFAFQRFETDAEALRRIREALQRPSAEYATNVQLKLTATSPMGPGDALSTEDYVFEARVGALPERGADLAELVQLARERAFANPLGVVESFAARAMRRQAIEVGRIRFVPLDTASVVAVDRIMTNWTDRGREAGPGDIVWFTSWSRYRRLEAAGSA